MFAKRFTSIRLAYAWRIGNAMILFSSLFLPWTIIWSDVYPRLGTSFNGWDVLLLPRTVVQLGLFTEDNLPAWFLSTLGRSMLEAVVPIVAIGYSIYCVIVIFRDGSGKPLSEKSPIGALLILLVTAYPVWHISRIGFHTQLSWGYGILIFGLISSALSEWFTISRFRVQHRNLEIPFEGREAG